MKRERLLFSALNMFLILIMGLLILYALPAEASSKLRLVCGLPITHKITQGMKIFKKNVEEKSMGEIKIELYPGGELYKAKDIQKVLPAGAIEMGIGNTAHLRGLSPLMAIGTYYLMVTDMTQWEEARGTILPLLDKAMQAKNVKIIVDLYYGKTALGSTKSLSGPADVKGLRIRGPTRTHLEVIKAWGGVPTAMGPGDVYDALARGALDGVCTGWSSHYKRAFYEVCKYFYGPMSECIYVLVINTRVWNGLTKDMQKVLQEAGRELKDFTRVSSLGDDRKCIEGIKEGGGVINIFTRQEIEEWTEATKSAYVSWLEACDKAGVLKEAKIILNALKVKGY